MIRFPLRAKPLKFKGALIGPGSGPAERIKALQIIVTRLVRNERIEGHEHEMEEARGYAEQLLNLAIRHGDRHKPTMEMADKWLLEKDLVHKLFKVLAPRFSNYSEAYTSMYRLPANYPSKGKFEAVLELKGNPYPPVIPQAYNKDNFIVNVLLRAAKQRHSVPASEGTQFLGTTETNVDECVTINGESSHGTEKEIVDDIIDVKKDRSKDSIETSTS